MIAPAPSLSFLHSLAPCSRSGRRRAHNRFRLIESRHYSKCAPEIRLRHAALVCSLVHQGRCPPCNGVGHTPVRLAIVHRRAVHPKRTQSATTTHDRLWFASTLSPVGEFTVRTVQPLFTPLFQAFRLQAICGECTDLSIGRARLNLNGQRVPCAA